MRACGPKIRQPVTPTENGAKLELNIVVTPEMLKAWNGRTPELRFEVKLGGVQPPDVYRAPPPVYESHYDAPRPRPSYESSRTSAVRDRPARRATGTIRDHFWALMRSGALLQQSDYRLGNRGLLIPEGGLCATTSAVNVLHAAFSHLGRDTRRFAASDDLVHRLVGEAWQRCQKDARLGLDFSTLGLVINEVANRLDADVGVHAELSYAWRLRSGVNMSELSGDDDTLALLAVTTGENSSHAIAVIGVDERRRTITYSDPNYPNQAIERQYWTNQRGDLQLDGFNGYGVLRDVLEIRTRTFDDSGAIRWRDFTGKRVRITGKDGHQRLTTIDRVEQPSPEYPSGRVIQFSYYFGGGGGGTWPLDDIAAIEEVKAPSAERIKSFEKYVGEKVRIRFTEPGLNRQYGDDTYLVESISREARREHHPFGGLEVKSATNEWGRKGVVPFEAIESVELVEAKLEGRRASPTGAAAKTRKRKIV